MASTCCSVIANLWGGAVYFPGTELYNATEASYWSIQEALLSPGCIVAPQTSTDISTIISAISNSANCDVAIKTQGHAPAAGFANINGGVTLDLSWLNETSISEDHSVASVGAGSTWGAVYTTLNPFKKTVAGGRNGAVGVGGLTIGGGISYYSPQVGWTCDTVVNYEVVLSSGDIINANSTTHTDLYKALKGGGNNFGVVTRIDFNTIDTLPLRAGYLYQSGQYAEQILDAFAGIASADTYDVHASIVTSFSFSSTTRSWISVSVPIYTLPETNPAVYEELFSIPNITASTTVTIENISTLAAEPPYPQKYQNFHTSTYNASSQLLTKLFHVANQTLNQADFPADISFSLAFEPLPTVLVQHGAGSNALGTSPSDGNGVILLISISWTESTSTPSANAIGQAVLDALDETARSVGGLHRFKYLNYAHPNQRPLTGYGEDNIDFLRRVSTKYDPHGMFQTKVPGGFKLGMQP
ncbi:hypothetical protein BX600DRAFT_471763 [Xylariales sp. PMI_506]|nr:hypothetical protein BX600DRAFT_471763 [Xylariales sp. PMI_506]